MSGRATLAAALLAAATAAAADTLHVLLRQSIALERPGATAAYAVDGTFVDASAVAGRVLILGRSVGTTQVAVVTPEGVETHTVMVDAPPPRPVALSSSSARPISCFEARYDSETGRLTNALDFSSHTGARTVRFHATSLTRTSDERRGDAGTALPSLSLQLDTPGRSIVLMDSRVDASPLTLSGTSLRGAHLRKGALEAHAGFTSSAFYGGLVLPAQRESALGLSYRIGGRGKTSLTPSLYYFGSSPYGGARGALASVLVDRGRPGDRVQARAEMGYGHEMAAAAEVTYAGSRSHGRVEARYQPDGSSSIGLGRPHGTFVEGDWSSRLTSRLTFGASGSSSRYDLAVLGHRSDAGSAELRYQATRQWSLRSGASVSGYDPDGDAPAVRSTTLPVELGWDGVHVGASALYRYQENTATNRGGSGGRLRARLRFPRFLATAYVDRQAEAATVDLVLREQPGLARALVELGLEARTPADLARLLQENAALVELGFIEGATVRLDPERLQAGLDVAWSPGTRQQLRARLLYDRASGTERVRTTRLATLSYSREVLGLELLGSVTFYSTELARAASGPSFQLGVRKRFDGAPRLPLFGRAAVSGMVFRDDDGDGRRAADAAGVAGTEVRLDGRRSTLADARGRFRFEDAGSGPHRVEVVLPPEAGAYFTTASAAVVDRAEEAIFGLALTPARLSGLVRDDAGAPLAGARVKLAGAGREAFAASDTSGRFAFAVAAGAYRVSLERDSLPPGYVAESVGPRAVKLARSAPERSDFEVAALRSVSGTVKADRPQEATVCLDGGTRCAQPGSDGRFVLRGLPPGAHTLVASVAGLVARRAVTLPDGPGAVGGIELEPRPVGP